MGLEWIIFTLLGAANTNGIRVNLRPRCGGLFDPIKGVCLFSPTIPWDTRRTLCLHGGGGVFVMSYIG